MIYLDTHVVVWYYANEKDRFSAELRSFMNQHDWLISPMVQLELQYLHEIGRINPTPDTILTDLASRVGLVICNKPFSNIVAAALSLTWTRDPFDRLIVAHAALNNDALVTKDSNILANYSKAHWSDF